MSFFLSLLLTEIENEKIAIQIQKFKTHERKSNEQINSIQQEHTLFFPCFFSLSRNAFDLLFCDNEITYYEYNFCFHRAKMKYLKKKNMIM